MNLTIRSLHLGNENNVMGAEVARTSHDSLKEVLQAANRKNSVGWQVITHN
ncbi:MAG: hypothetical protein WD824_15665 [Cyclobacteriaceae bacterium]